MLTLILFLVFMFLPSIPDYAEIHRRESEIAKLGQLADRIQHEPSDAASTREFIAYLDHHEEWDRTQMFAQLKHLGKTFQETAEAHANFKQNVLPAIKKGLKDSSGHVQREAALAAGAFGSLSKDALPELLDAMNANAHNDTGWFAADAIGSIGPQAIDAVPALEKAGKKSSSLANRTRRAIERIRAGADKGP